MAKRGISDKQRAWLVRQLDDWQSHGLLFTDQTAPILDLYETQVELAERKRSIALVTLMGIAALMVGLSALLLVGYNWRSMPASLKLFIVFGTIIGTQTVACVLRFRRHATLLSEVVFFLGCLFYGTGIFLVAQIFHINAHYPNGVWWWALGVLPFALCLDTLLLHTLLVALLAIWCGMEILGFAHLGLLFFGGWGFVPNAAYSLPLLALPGLIWAYRKSSIVTVTLYVAVITWWVILQPVAWRAGGETVYFIGAVGGLMLVVAENHAKGSRFAIPYRLIGVLLAAGALLTISFYEFNKYALLTTNDLYISRSFSGTALLMATVAIAILSAATVCVVAAFKRGDHRRQYLPLGLVLLMAIFLYWNVFIGEMLLPTIVANVAMIFLAFWLMGVGFREDRVVPFAAGVLYFLLWTVVRYVDLFGDFGGMLGAALMFFLCGGALFGAALYWRQRRKIQHG